MLDFKIFWPRVQIVVVPSAIILEKRGWHQFKLFPMLSWIKSPKNSVALFGLQLGFAKAQWSTLVNWTYFLIIGSEFNEKQPHDKSLLGNIPFLYPLETWENQPLVFWSFQGVQKGNSGFKKYNAELLLFHSQQETVFKNMSIQEIYQDPFSESKIKSNTEIR